MEFAEFLLLVGEAIEAFPRDLLEDLVDAFFVHLVGGGLVVTPDYPQAGLGPVTAPGVAEAPSAG